MRLNGLLPEEIKVKPKSAAVPVKEPIGIADL